MGQILDALKIEIPQLITHVIGFLLALWVLKRFAWKPLLALLDERQAKIKSRFDEIDAKYSDAEKLHEEYEAKLREIDQEARRRLTEAVNEGDKIAAEIKERAREDAREIRNRTKAEIEQDYAKARVQLKEEVINMTLIAAEKIILERLDEPKHRQLISSFIDEVPQVK